MGLRMQYAPVIAQDIMSAVDERNDCMAALHKLAAKFAADQPRGSRYENAATGGSRHDTFLVLGTSGPTYVCCWALPSWGKHHTNVGRLKQSDQNTQFRNELVSDL
jgi:hypothetical protein